MSPLLRDRLGSLLMLAFVATLWVQRDYTSPFGGMFPDTMMAFMVFFIVLTLILSFTPWSAMPKDQTEASEDDAPTSSGLQQVLVVIVLLALWTSLYRSVGFALTGTLGFGAIAWYLGDRHAGARGIVRALGLGAVVSFVVYMVFDYFLLVPLPPGFLFG
ncbi:tripartite tricarboxylate transporter TctB family protein [Castellaniella sp.]|uniref:tripartite tricarboxylate transporter TctB family protein n=1 Tax=Castellaniella sp. TaxID=1955812 RepID=UPI003A94F8B2